MENILKNSDIEIIYDNSSYEVSLINRGSRNIVFVFGSAGFAFGDGPIKEFKNSIFSLPRDNFDICWIIDKSIQWYNSDDNPNLTLLLEGLQKSYDFSVALGESMGGCAALYFSQYLNVNRVIAFGPQFSMS